MFIMQLRRTLEFKDNCAKRVDEQKNWKEGSELSNLNRSKIAEIVIEFAEVIDEILNNRKDWKI